MRLNPPEVGRLVLPVMVVSEAPVLPDRSRTFDGLVDLKVRGVPPGAAMAKDGLAVAADSAIDFPPPANRAWDGVMPILDLLVGSPPSQTEFAGDLSRVL